MSVKILSGFATVGSAFLSFSRNLPVLIWDLLCFSFRVVLANRVPTFSKVFYSDTGSILPFRSIVLNSRSGLELSNVKRRRTFICWSVWTEGVAEAG